MIFGSLSFLAQTLTQFPIAHKVGVMGLSAALFAMSFEDDKREHALASSDTASNHQENRQDSHQKNQAEPATPDNAKNENSLFFQSQRYQQQATANALLKSLQENASPTPEASALAELENNLASEQFTPVPDTLYTYKQELIKPGDTLSTAFKRADVPIRAMYSLLNGHPKAKSLTKIHPGHHLEFVVDEHSRLVELQHVKNPLNRVIFRREASGFAHELINRTPEIKLVRTEGTITSSLYEAAKNSQLEDRLIMSLANIFGWDVDFALDIRKDDSFVVVYEEKYLDGELLGTGNIIAAEFVNRGEHIQAVRYTDSKGDTQYYTPEGRNMRKAFLRAPVDFRRISSNFNPRRLHPITKTIRPHRGIDYAAKTGTPVWSSGDGKVLQAGYNKFNGNYVVIQHNNNIQTKYLHLHKRKVKQGQRVRQKQIIGTVGSTGLSTAPHLHYEFLLNGVHRNPRTIVSKLPKANPVPKAERERFFASTKPLVAKLQSLNQDTKNIARKNSADNDQPIAM